MVAPVFAGEESPDTTGQGCSVTRRRCEAMDSATESNLPMVLLKTQAMVKRCGKSTPGFIEI